MMSGECMWLGGMSLDQWEHCLVLKGFVLDSRHGDTVSVSIAP